MKTLKTITRLSFIAIALFLVSCGDDDDDTYVPPTTAPTSASYVTGKVDGADFSTIIFGTSTAQCSKANPGPDQFITVFGGDLAANSITIGLSAVTTTGTYELNQNTNSFCNYSAGSGEIAYATSAECNTAHGTVVVTYMDNVKIEGTFSFTGVNTEDCAGGTKTVTEGSFRGTFQQ